jgi:hypothetical protein
MPGEPHTRRRLTVLCPVERGELLPLGLHLAFHRVELAEQAGHASAVRRAHVQRRSLGGDEGHPGFAENLYPLGSLPPVPPETGGLEHEDYVDLPTGSRGHHRLVARPLLTVQSGDVVVDFRADDYEAPSIDDPLLIGQLVGEFRFNV